MVTFLFVMESLDDKCNKTTTYKILTKSYISCQTMVAYNPLCKGLCYKILTFIRQ